MVASSVEPGVMPIDGEAGYEELGPDEIETEAPAEEDGPDAGTETAIEVGVAEEEAAATLLSHVVQTVEVDVRVCVDKVVNTDVKELSPEE